MSLNRTSEWNVMTIRISRELQLFNFERLDELCPRIGHPVKSYDHSNFSSASVVQFRTSRYIMSPNRTSEWNLMTIRISRELQLFNFERLDELCPRIGHPVKSYDHSNFSSSSVVQFRASRSFMSLNQTSEWNVMTIRICREHSLFNFEPFDILCPRIGLLCEKLWPFEFLDSFRCSISSVSIYYVPESDIRVKSYDHSNFSRASVVQFLASRYIMSPNQTSEWNVMIIRIIESFRCSISSV